MSKATKPVSPTRKARKTRKQSRSAPVHHELESWLDGYQAGICCQPDEPPRDKFTDRASWSAGWLKGHAHHHAYEVLCHARRQPGADINMGGDYQGIGTVGWCNGMRVGMRMAVSQAWKGRP